jgi:hypothetical protein
MVLLAALCGPPRYGPSPVDTQPPSAASSTIVPAVRFIASPFGYRLSAIGLHKSSAAGPLGPMADGRKPEADISASVACRYTRPALALNFRQNRKSLPMSFLRYFPLFLLLIVAVLLTAALSSQPANSSRIPPHSEPSTVALTALDHAIAHLDPKHVAWLETTLWQKACVAQFTYEAQGHFLAAPNNRFHLELTTRQGRGAATYLVVSDGQALWEGTRFEDGAWHNLVRVDLQQILQGGLREGPAESLQTEWMPQAMFGGVRPVLHALRACMTWTNRESVRRQGRVFIKLTGSLSEATAKTLALPGQSWPNGVPHACRLYLDSESLWPFRLEWWGRQTPRSSETLLVQMEFRDPIFNQPISPERCAKEFTFPSAAHKNFDHTPEAAERLRARPAVPCSTSAGPVASN